MSFIDELVDQQIISSWNARFKEINHGVSSRVKSFKQDNYVGIPGMNQIGKFLAKPWMFQSILELKKLLTKIGLIS